ncbi:MAG: Rv2175c family DNA-binding protein [Actinomycetaceae bacterium]|nr:Rv2175c family DNA-binding protein [Actinomycetaceae bacterium]
MTDSLWTSYTWRTLTESAEYLGIEVKRLRSLIKDRALLAVKHDDGPLQIPEPFLCSEAGNVGIPEELKGTVMVLLDGGMSDMSAMQWLLSEDESLGTTPIKALEQGRKKEVRRIAGALAL